MEERLGGPWARFQSPSQTHPSHIRAAARELLCVAVVDINNYFGQ